MITLDIETKSDKDLKKCGVYAYTESPQFEILLLSYSVDGGEVQVIDLKSGEMIPDEIISALSDERVIKRAFNVNFERVCLSKYLGRKYLSPIGWRCSMIHARTLGLPSSLADVGEVLRIEQQKMSEGKALIRFFCVPDKNGEFRSPADYPDKWELFKQYNKRDVEAEIEIDRRLSKFPVPDFIWQEFYLDQQINDCGILIDTELADAAIVLDEHSKAKLTAEMKRLTGIDNPNSVYQLLDWLGKQGYKSDTLGKDRVKELIKTAEDPVRNVLELRLQLSRSSVKKYQAMKQTACSDNRARGMFSFYGAARSGRWAGKNIQLQNLPQNHIPDLTTARNTVKYGCFEEVEMLYGDVPDTLSQLIRTAFIPQRGCKFIIADFSAIEARVIAWLAGEEWRMKAFADGEDIYCASASRIFGVPVKKNGINGHLRQKGKVAELACGYGGSVGAMKAMGGGDLNMTDEELKQLVDEWRVASPNIVSLWHDIENTAKAAIICKDTQYTHGLTFTCKSGMLFITLPSGRFLSYARPHFTKNRFGQTAIAYMGVGESKRWQEIETFGGKLTENIVQAIARDLLCFAMKTLAEHSIVAHVHDEIIIECPKDTLVSEICSLMSRTPKWAEGLVLRADGYECEYYKKD